MPGILQAIEALPMSGSLLSPSSVLGVITFENDSPPPYTERAFFKQLSLEGIGGGMTVFVIPVERIDWNHRTAAGYILDPASGEWVAGNREVPRWIYDRCFIASRRQYECYRGQIRRLIHAGGEFLGQGLRGKWDVYKQLCQQPQFRPYLPPTERWDSSRKLDAWLGERREVLLKPQGGSQGKGIVLLRKLGGELYAIKGRDAGNRRIVLSFTDSEEAEQWLRRHTGTRKYLLQPFLQLQTRQGDAFDIRSFVQKNGEGQWQLIGMAARIGKPGSLTSNLHGGGTAFPALPFLQSEFGPERAKKLVSLLRTLSMQIAEELEKNGRLAELGIDFGIDRSGKLWIIEVNSKPGRTVFSQIGNETARNQSVANLISYTHYLCNRQLGG